MKRKTKAKLEPEVQAKIGRPSKFSPALAETLCYRISNGESLRKISAEEDMPHIATILRWLDQDATFREQYMRARTMQATLWAEEVLEISDEIANDSYEDDDGNMRTNHEVVARSRLRVDTRKWMLSKMLPKVYGDKMMNEITGKDGGPIQVETFDASKLTPEEREVLRVLLAKGKG